MRMPQFRIRTLMISIAFVALLLTVVGQAILLQRSMVREKLLRAEAEKLRANAEQARVLAEAQAKHAQDALAEFSDLRDRNSALLDRMLKSRKP